MSFLQPMLLIGLPLALLPILIHLINQHRHRTVKWAAMMFLLDAKRLTKGVAKLRQILILSLRVLAILCLVFAASRPLAGGWLGIAGGKPDTILILLDRSASMEQRDLETGESKRLSALEKLSDLLGKTARNSEVVLIDSVTLAPTPITEVETLNELPEVEATATAASIPALLESALTYLSANESGRTDVWLASDLRQSDWEPEAGLWTSLRSELASRETVRLLLLTFEEPPIDNLSVSVTSVKRQPSPEGSRLVMDLNLQRQSPDPEGQSDIPVEFTVNGTRTVETMTVSGTELIRLGHSIDLGDAETKGWGRIDLPEDDNGMDNTVFFVYDDEATRHTSIVSDDLQTAQALEAAVTSPVEASVSYSSDVFASGQTAQIAWEKTALLIWQAALPDPESTDAALLQQHVESGRSLLFLPPEGESGETWNGFEWTEWRGGSEPIPVAWWRTESGLLANTRSGAPLPVDELAVFRTRGFEGEFQPLLRLDGELPMVGRLFGENTGSAYIWGTLPRADLSSLASDGIVFFVMLHRALSEGANAVSNAQVKETGKSALSKDDESIEVLDSAAETIAGTPGLLPSALRLGTNEETHRLLALVRPSREDDIALVSEESIASLLEGVEYRQISDELNSGSSLASEIWRAFLIAMALALLAEAILCLPPPREEETSHAPLSTGAP